MKIKNLKTKVSPFSGISLVNHYFNETGLTELIDNELGQRVEYAGYQYGKIFRNLTNVFLSGGSVVEDIDSYLKEHLKSIPNNNVPSPDTVLRSLTELTTENTEYISKSQQSNNQDYKLMCNN